MLGTRTPPIRLDLKLYSDKLFINLSNLSATKAWVSLRLSLDAKKQFQVYTLRYYKLLKHGN